ncbi:MAG: hypothetical protein ACRC3Y_07085, partial [Romboutsia sp.]|uniref:hypothetical protein n=1 Tax=Romboutsia sp. TaxID=1965302 RepID=UPI003F2E24A5
MGIEKIKCTKYELEKKINDCCKELKIVCEKYMDKGNLMQFTLLKGNLEGKLRVYITKNGLKIDDSIFKDKDLYNEFEKNIKDVLEKTETGLYKFKNIDENQFKIIFDEINKMCNNDIQRNDRENRDPNKTYFFEMKNFKTGEKVLISKYRNGTLTLSGVNWLLLTDICSIIDSEINSTPLDIFDRILEAKNIVVNEIDTKYTVENYGEEEEIIKEDLTCEVYNFLDEHFRNYLISAQRIISSGIVLPEYSPILCPLAKVLEGYLKRLLVELN